MPEGTGTEGGSGTSTEGAPGNGTSGAGPAGASGAGAGDKTFTQAELDKVLSDRLARERAKYEGYDDMKRKAEEFDKLQEATKSETEKAVEKARKEAEAAARAESNKTWETRVVRSEVRVAAAGKLADPEDAVRFLDLSTFKVDDNGEVDGKAIAAAIDELVKTKPYLAANGTRGTRDFDAGSRTPAGGGRSMNDLIRSAAGR